MRGLSVSVALLMVLNAALLIGQGQRSAANQTTVVIDTTLGRLRCKLFEQERPRTTALFIALAEGNEDRVEPGSGFAKPGKPHYDGTRLYSIPAGIRGGDRSDDGPSGQGANLDWGTDPDLKFDRPGRLAMRRPKGQPNDGEFMVLDHADAEDDNGAATIFGQCDDASVALVTSISHRLAEADNRPETPIVIDRVSIVRGGRSMPSRPAHFVVPSVVPWPKSAVPAPDPTGPTALIDTTVGQISCKLFTQQSPIATGVFMGLADGTKDWKNPLTQRMEHGKRFYDGMPFDRVIPDFVIQSGDYTGDISGSTDIGFRFKNESTTGLNFDRPGRLAFGNNGPDTNNSEIFITEQPMRRLNGGFTIIGQCDDPSVKLVQAIARVPRDANNRPITPVKIIRIDFTGR